MSSYVFPAVFCLILIFNFLFPLFSAAAALPTAPQIRRSSGLFLSQCQVFPVSVSGFPCHNQAFLPQCQASLLQCQFSLSQCQVFPVTMSDFPVSVSGFSCHSVRLPCLSASFPCLSARKTCHSAKCPVCCHPTHIITAACRNRAGIRSLGYRNDSRVRPAAHT